MPANLIPRLASPCGSVQSTPGSAEQALFDALNNQDVQAIQQALERNPKLDAVYSNRFSALHLAAHTGRTDLMLPLLERGADLASKDCYGNTPLHYAALNFHREAVSLLLERGARVNDVNLKQDSPLHFVSAVPTLLYFETLARKKQSLLLRTFAASDSLLKANRSLAQLQADKDNVSNQLLSKGSAIDAVNQDGQSALFYAAMAKDPAGIRFLLGRGANPQLKDKQGRNLLHELAKGPLPLEALLSEQPKFLATDYDQDQAQYPALLALIQQLIQQGLDPNLKDLSYGTPLHSAAMTGQEQILNLLINNGARVDTRAEADTQPDHLQEDRLPRPTDVALDFSIRYGSTPLMLAAALGDLASVRALAEAGASVNSMDLAQAEADTYYHTRGDTPLSLASGNGHAAVVDYLLSRGAKIEYQGLSALSRAIENKQEAVVRLLLNQKPSLDFRDPNGETPLTLAIRFNQPAIVQLLLDAGAKNSGLPLFPAAAERSDTFLLDSLLKAGADINALDRFGNTALHVAADKARPEIYRWLLEHGARDDIVNNAGKPPLFQIRPPSLLNPQLSLEQAKPMLSNPKVYRQLDGNASTLLHQWIQNNLTDFSRYALSQGADINASDNTDMTPLHHAIGLEKTQALELLLEQGADPQRENGDGQTPLRLAISAGKLPMVKLLYQRAKPERWSTRDYQAFFAAIKGNHLEMVVYLLSIGFDPTVPDSQGLNALHQAVSQQQPKLVAALLTAGVPVQSFTVTSGLTALHFSARQEDSTLTAELLKAGADPNAAARSIYFGEGTFGGDTPLHLAAQRGRLATVQLLLDQGADPLRRNHEGMQPLHSAARSGQIELLELFKARGHDFSAKDWKGHGLLSQAIFGAKPEAVKWLLNQMSPEQISLEISQLGQPINFLPISLRSLLLPFAPEDTR